MTANIEVIGLGAGDINQLSLGIYRKLTNEKSTVYVRTLDHPVVQSLQKEGVTFFSYDETYEKNDQFEAVYEQIVDHLVEAANEKGSIIYAVPGHPMLAEMTVQLLLKQSKVTTTIVGGQSYLDDLFTALKIDPIEGFQFVDATNFKRNQLEYRQHLVFCQVYDSFIASEVKLQLLEDLPPEHPITVLEAVGSERESLTTIPLVELDHQTTLSNLTSVYVPPISEDHLNHQFSRLREVIAQLRGPNGCPWDKKQTHHSLRKYLIEEAYEFIQAVNEEDDEGIIEEIGDVLLQVMLHSQIGEDEGFFTIDDVIVTLTNKMIRRHPHVFGDTNVDNAEQVVENWNEIKKKEKGNEKKSLLDNIPKDLPQILKAEELQKQAAKVGFDWSKPNPIWDKIEEEIEEVKEAIEINKAEEIESEFGDLLFAIVNLARYYKVNPELAILRTNNKFTSRFTYIEKKVEENNLSMEEMTLDELDAYWDEAKNEE